MKILHTSDWHLGRSLYGRKRYEEFESFLMWLSSLIEEQAIDTLLVAGDVFDNQAPGNRAQELYYNLLHRLAASSCRHVVIISGNHDSAAFLNAPREVLRYLNIHVLGSITGVPGDEILLLKDNQDNPELIVCAVPYLRDRDIRRVESGETLEDKERKLMLGIHQHYQQVCRQAKRMQEQLNKPVPLVVMGHLFAAGGRTVEGDGVRELYVGSLARVGADTFPEYIDYLALGHLHVAQKVNGADHRRYCGSPLAMSFGEVGQEKSVCILEFTETGTEPVVSCMKVPVFQELEQVRGDMQAILLRIEELKACKSKAWLEIVYEGQEVMGSLRKILDEAVKDSALEILRIKNHRGQNDLINEADGDQTLDDIEVVDVFHRLLEAYQIPQAQQEELTGIFQQVLLSIYEEDRAEEPGSSL